MENDVVSLVLNVESHSSRQIMCHRQNKTVHCSLLSQNYNSSAISNKSNTSGRGKFSMFVPVPNYHLCPFCVKLFSR